MPSWRPSAGGRNSMGCNWRRPAFARRFRESKSTTACKHRTPQSSRRVTSVPTSDSRTPPTPWLGSACRTHCFSAQEVQRAVIPRCTYTDPEVAQVGLTETEAARQQIEIDSFRVDLQEVDRAVLDGDEQGFAVVHTRRGTGRVVGATIVARHAGEMIGEMTLLMTQRRCWRVGQRDPLLSHPGRSAQTHRRRVPAHAADAATGAFDREMAGLAPLSRSGKRPHLQPARGAFQVVYLDQYARFPGFGPVCHLPLNWPISNCWPTSTR